MRELVKYGETCHGERSDAQVFLERLFIAFGHPGYKEAGAILEDRVRDRSRGTARFVDLLWRPRVLIEMKSRGEKLQRHYDQAFNYWLEAVPQRPRYVVLCNFEEFWIYDFDRQLRDPVEQFKLAELPHRYVALNFLFPDDRPPQFGNDRVAVTRGTADRMAQLFNELVGRGEVRARAMRFILQCVVAMFADDIDLLPDKLFSAVSADCLAGRGSTYDLLGGLFRQMNDAKAARGGRYKGVPYFNGGLFAVVDPIELTAGELALLSSAATEDWSRVDPPIFGTLFQSSIGEPLRHALGAHFTAESEIQRVVQPTIVKPWKERIEAARTARELMEIRSELLQFRVLDPACGSGNFLYVSYRELKKLELLILGRLHDEYGRKIRDKVGHLPSVSLRQFFGIDIEPFAVELAKVELLLAKKLSLDEQRDFLESGQLGLDIVDQALPLDNLDANITCDDALFCDWPAVDAIVGNPPFQSKNKAQQELGASYMAKVRKRYPDVPGRADYCVYWFRRAHDALKPGGRAGLVGTNTIRENDSRRGGLDYIVQTGGTITEAVSSQVWPGKAVVHVSIANWLKGPHAGKKVLWTQVGDDRASPWSRLELPHINAALSAKTDVTMARDLPCNLVPKTTFQGQTPGHKGFLLDPAVAEEWQRAAKLNHEVLFPYLIGDDLLDNPESAPGRFIVDLGAADLLQARRYRRPLAHLEKVVLPARRQAAERESTRNTDMLRAEPRARVNRHHRQFLEHWWLPSFRREDMLLALQGLSRYVACSRVTRRPIFEFIDSRVRPSDALQVFAFEDDYSFGILQSDVHWQWFVARCSGLKVDPRYTSETVYNTFPWPQLPQPDAVKAVAAAGEQLRRTRRKLARDHQIGLRELYRSIEGPGAHPLKELHVRLDRAVRHAYGMTATADPLAFLLDLNASLATRSASETQGPGWPSLAKKVRRIVSRDCVAVR